jgi:hypothetical protein
MGTSSVALDKNLTTFDSLGQQHLVLGAASRITVVLRVGVPVDT